MKDNTRTIAMVGMLTALAYIVVALIRVPVVSFLKYEPKDVIVVIGGFLFGPLSAFAISAIASLVEMVTISDTGIIGCVMNILSTCAFACTAAFIYKKKRSFFGAVIGLIAGALVMTAVMLLWNYLITPMYMGYPRAAVAEMLLPVFLPFNLLKGGLNAAITMLVYKPLVQALRKAGLIHTREGQTTGKFNIGAMLVIILVIATCVLAILAFQGII